METIVDLRSDTVTRPTPAMRRAIAEAVVGDDVFGDDPTVQELERRVAERAGKEAALFVPSGAMGNQIAVACQTRPGDEVVLGAESHIYLYEQGGIASNSGCLAHPVPTDRGVLAAGAVHAAVRGEDDHFARVALLCLENTHNRQGGAIVPLAALRAAADAAREHGMAVHLDGARLWNAAVATGIPIREWASVADTVMMCFSKGLGAPIGSILAGPQPLIRKARRVRKRLGGGMRQVGILAAACLHALDHHVDRLADDHRRAGALARGLSGTPGMTVSEPDTNILFVGLEHASLDASTVVPALAARGVRVTSFGPKVLRAVTHLDVDDDGIVRAIEAFQSVVAERSAAISR